MTKQFFKAILVLALAVSALGAPQKKAAAPHAKAIYVHNRAGQRIDTITVPERPSNCCFAGPERRTILLPLCRWGGLSLRRGSGGHRLCLSGVGLTDGLGGAAAVAAQSKKRKDEQQNLQAAEPGRDGHDRLRLGEDPIRL